MRTISVLLKVFTILLAVNVASCSTPRLGRRCVIRANKGAGEPTLFCYEEKGYSLMTIWDADKYVCRHANEEIAE
jgi:hypothetical protein